MSEPDVDRARDGGVRLSAITLNVNGRSRRLDVDPRTSLLDALREQLRLSGTKKGCDHGQCGACTVLVNGRRVNSCLTLAVMRQDDEITTIEGMGRPGRLSAMQAAFVERDGFQCGYCTPGQICSAVGMLGEVRAGWPSHATADVSSARIELTDEELRERMSGNICRCAAYPNIAAAIRDVAADSGADIAADSEAAGVDPVPRHVAGHAAADLPADVPADLPADVPADVANPERGPV
ncbi:2Fe-2S iron-sulfur cluster-binding protein [Streptomyces sp. NPDC088341]|uniref:2Fe-2S iron-sulfur cluster-binding protein n=1 Tax=Streptomyces sp. NPDC088341 TaxID=3154870 RepID=UPI00343247EF